MTFLRRRVACEVGGNVQHRSKRAPSCPVLCRSLPRLPRGYQPSTVVLLGCALSLHQREESGWRFASRPHDVIDRMNPTRTVQLVAQNSLSVEVCSTLLLCHTLTGPYWQPAVMQRVSPDTATEPLTMHGDHHPSFPCSAIDCLTRVVGSVRS